MPISGLPKPSSENLIFDSTVTPWHSRNTSIDFCTLTILYLIHMHEVIDPSALIIPFEIMILRLFYSTLLEMRKWIWNHKVDFAGENGGILQLEDKLARMHADDFVGKNKQLIDKSEIK